MLKTIPATDLRPGDSFKVDGYCSVYRVTLATPANGENRAAIGFRDPLECWNYVNLLNDLTVTVGYTSRRAKRQRGKIRRRARLCQARDAQL
jgi:hypothetical protein